MRIKPEQLHAALQKGLLPVYFITGDEPLQLGELADATIKNDRAGITDGIGDVMVCLVNYCALQDINLVSCMEAAYAEIKHRKGTLLPNGVFVKE